jgi:hypothetical protein
MKSGKKFNTFKVNSVKTLNSLKMKGVPIMAFTKEFLKGLGISDDVADSIFAERGKELNSSNSSIQTLTSERDELAKQLQALQAEHDSLSAAYEADKQNYSTLSTDLESYKQKVTAFEEADAARKAEEAAKAHEAELNGKITAAIGDAKFTSDYARNGVIADMKSAYEQDSTVDLASVFTSLTQDKAGVLATEHQKVSATEVDSELQHIRSLMGLT